MHIDLYIWHQCTAFLRLLLVKKLITFEAYENMRADLTSDFMGSREQMAIEETRKLAEKHYDLYIAYRTKQKLLGEK